VPDRLLERVRLKSGNQAIPLAQQRTLYQHLLRVLKPRGLLVHLGFLFDDEAERDQLREIARCRDRLAGRHRAVDHRPFLTRDARYTRLAQAGFVDIRCGMQVHYTINAQVVTHAAFPAHHADDLHAAFQAQQAKALLLRRKGRMHFQGASSTMRIPGKITLAHRPL
jgi:hypothetical protein